MEYLDDALIIQDAQNECWMKLVDLKTQQSVDFGQKGNGPDEVLMPQSILNKEKGEIELYGVNQHKMLVFNLDSIKEYKISPYKVQSGVEFQDLFATISLGRDKYLAHLCDLEGNKRYAVLDENFKMITKGGSFPDYEKLNSCENITKAMVFQGYLVFDEGMNRGFTFYVFCDGFELFQLKETGEFNVLKGN